MVGLIVVSAFILYICIALLCIYLVNGKKKKLVVLMISILIPTADVIVGRIYFAYLCNTQSGQFIYKTVNVGDEYLYKPGEMIRHRLDETGRKLAIAIGGEINRKKLRERYEFPSTVRETYYSKMFHIVRDHTFIEDPNTNSILSEAVTFTYFGGWLENIYQPSPRYCAKDKYKIHSNLFDKTFLSK